MEIMVSYIFKFINNFVLKYNYHENRNQRRYQKSDMIVASF